MFCSHCGAQIAEADAKFCPSCGEPLGNAKEMATHAIPSAAQPAAPKAKMALWKKILIGVGVFIIGVVALALWATAPLLPPVEAHLASLRAGNIEEAYEQTSGAFRKATSLADYRRFVAANPILTQAAETSFPSKKWENNTGSVTGTLTADDGSVVPVRFNLIHEQDEWRIIGISFNPEDQE